MRPSIAHPTRYATPTSHLALVVAAVLAFLLVTSRPARADDEVSVVVTGEDSLRTPLATALEGWLREHGHRVIADALPAKASQLVHDCILIDDEPCARRVVDGAATRAALVFASIEVAVGADGARNATITGYWFTRGAPALAERRFCERCTAQGVGGLADDLMTALASARTRGTGRLSVTSSPTGAHVLLDGQAIGVTPLDYDAAPGNHRVVLRHDRHEVEAREFVLREGETTKLDVPLTPARAEPARSRVLPATLLVGGAALAAGGAVLLAIDEDPSLDQRYYRDTAPAGVALLASGGVAIAVGAYLWLRAPSRSTPTVAVTQHGLSVGWTGSF
jgi:hypothetical protein